MPCQRFLADHPAGARQVRCYYYRIIKKINLVCPSREIIDFIRLAARRAPTRIRRNPPVTGALCEHFFSVFWRRLEHSRMACACACACVRVPLCAHVQIDLRRHPLISVDRGSITVIYFNMILIRANYICTDCGGLWGALRQVDGGRRRPGGGGDAALVRGAARRRGLATAARLRMRLVLIPHHKRYHSLSNNFAGQRLPGGVAAAPCCRVKIHKRGRFGGGGNWRGGRALVDRGGV